MRASDSNAPASEPADHGAGNAPDRRNMRGLSTLLVLTVVTLACLPKLGNAFVWDDIALIQDGSFIHDPKNLAAVFGVDAMFAADSGKFQQRTGGAQLDTYRPITIATFMLDSLLSGRAPLAYHLDNLLVHLLCVALVIALGRKLLPDKHRWLASWAGAWFGLHPLLGEAHIWIDGRSDLWCSLFGLGGLLLFIDARSAHGGKRALLLMAAGVAWLLGLLSKESLAPALLVVAFWDAGGFERPLSALEHSRAQLARWLPIVLALASYTCLRQLALHAAHFGGEGAQLWLALQRLPVLLLDGLRSALVPTRIMPRYLNEEYARLPDYVLGLALALALGLGAGVWMLRRRWPLGAFALSWFAAVLAPAALIATLNWYGFGRYLYLPLALLAIALADLFGHLLERLRNRDSARALRLCQWGALAYLALFTLRLATSAANWNGPAAFYLAIIAEDPAASHGYGGLGRWLVEHGELAQAIPALEAAVARNDHDSRNLNNLGVAYLRSGRLDEAQAIAQRGVQRFAQQHEKFDHLEQLIDQARRVSRQHEQRE